MEKALSSGLSEQAFRYSLGYLDYSGRFGVNNVSSSAKEEFLQYYYSQKFTSLRHYFESVIVDAVEEKDLLKFGGLNKSSYYCVGCGNETISAKKSLIENLLCYSFSLKTPEAHPSLQSSSIRVLMKTEDNSKGLFTPTPFWLLKFGFGGTGYAIPEGPGVLVQTGYYSMVRLKMQKIISLNRREKPCNETAENDAAKKCMIRCIDENIDAYLKCRMIWYSTWAGSDDPTQFCNLFDKPSSNVSVIHFAFAADKLEVDAKGKECAEKCVDKCEKILLSVSLENQMPYSLFDPDMIKDVAPENNMSAVTVHIKDNALYEGGVVTLKEYDTQSLTEFIGNVGGMLGLFVGATIMTIVQLVLFFVGHTLDKKQVSKVQKIQVMQLTKQ